MGSFVTSVTYYTTISGTTEGIMSWPSVAAWMS